jgi:hypothetical protein
MRFHVASMTCTVSHHCPVLPSLCEGAQSTSLDEMLGNQGVTESNMMQYLGEFKSKVQHMSIMSLGTRLLVRFTHLCALLTRHHRTKN